MESRYGDLKFSKILRSINESKQTLKCHISTSICPRRVYKGSNWRSRCQLSYSKWGCLYFAFWIEICSFKITKKMKFFELEQNVFEASHILASKCPRTVNKSLTHFFPKCPFLSIRFQCFSFKQIHQKNFCKNIFHHF